MNETGQSGQKKSKSSRSEAYKPQPVFLVAAALFAVTAIVAYSFEYVIVLERELASPFGFALLLTGLVLLALGCVFCYRSPALGNRLLGYGMMMDKPDKDGAQTGFSFSAGFKDETGKEEKARSTVRKRSRHTRKQLAQATRDLQQQRGEQSGGHTEPETDTNSETKNSE